MSDRVTLVSLPGTRAGLLIDGREIPSLAIGQLRDMARAEIEHWSPVLEADDSDFRVEDFLGPIAQRNRHVTQEGRHV